MQTFLPYPDFEKSLRCLDYRRAGKQRVEAKQILDILQGRGKTLKSGQIAWGNHAMVRAWRGYEDALATYMNLSVDLWIERGYKNTMKKVEVKKKFDMPPWFGEDRFHTAHRASLLAKKFEHYKQFGWTEKPKINYYYPVP